MLEPIVRSPDNGDVYDHPLGLVLSKSSPAGPPPTLASPVVTGWDARSEGARHGR